MKRNKIKFIYSFAAASALLMSMSACTDDVVSSAGGQAEDTTGISFTVNLEPTKSATRADDAEWTISDGKHIKKLLFAVYKKNTENGETSYDLDEYFLKDPDNTSYNTLDYKDNISINLIPNSNEDPDTEYRIIFWAYSGDKEVFDLSDLRKIKVNYDKVNNNDQEKLDAFYNHVDFSFTDTDWPKTVKLKRPFAQINIGTSGWDYEGQAILKPNPEVIKYSKITVTSAANYFNAVEDKVWEQNDLSQGEYATSDITFDWERLPAFVKATQEQVDALNSENITNITDFKEEFLRINLNNDNVYAPYIGWVDYKTRTDKYCDEVNQDPEKEFNEEDLRKTVFTETFKYLSTCYILVPGGTVPPSGSVTEEYDDKDKEYYGSTTDITFYCSKDKKDDSPLFTMSSVFVGRNYRTNLVAQPGSGLFMTASQFKVDLYKEYFGDYYKRSQATDQNWGDGNNSGYEDNDDYDWPPLDEITDSPLVLENIQLGGTDWGNISGKYVDLIKFMDGGKDVKITISTKELLDNPVIKQFKSKGGSISYEGYLGGNKKYEGIISENGIEVNLNTTNDIFSIYQNSSPVTTTLTEYETKYDEKNYNAGDKPVQTLAEEDLYLRYYPVEFRVKSILSGGNDENIQIGDFVMTLRVYTSYKFTFSSTSQDEGKDIWNGIVYYNQTGGSLTGEANSYYMYNNNNDQKSESLHVLVQPRTGTSENDRIYALTDSDMGDHLRVKGAHNEKGHYIKLKKLQEDCKITVKIGRDASMDNSDRGKTIAQDRSLHINWGQCDISQKADGSDATDDKIELWEGIAPTEENINSGKLILSDATSSGTKTTYANSETIIMTAPTTDISKSKDGSVTIYVDASGHCYYWILVSEPDPAQND